MKNAMIQAQTVNTGLFTTADAAAQHLCDCAELVFRNNHDGSRTHRLRGKAGCPKCHGVGAVRPCTHCNATGMTSAVGTAPVHVCRACHGCGSVALNPKWTGGKPVYA